MAEGRKVKSVALARNAQGQQVKLNGWIKFIQLAYVNNMPTVYYEATDEKGIGQDRTFDLLLVDASRPAVPLRYRHVTSTMGAMFGAGVAHLYVKDASGDDSWLLSQRG